MKTLYIECAMGAAGNMLMAALVDLVPEPEVFEARMNGLGLGGVHMHLGKRTKCGIVGRAVDIHVHGEEEESRDVHPHDHDHAHGHDHDHAHHHSGMEDIARIIGALPVSDAVRENARAVYALIAKAESHAHGVPVEQIHFHEVGAMDAVADIVGVCMLIEMIAPDRIVVSPIHVGSGQVRCQHGILPVPAPATAHILRGVPTYGGDIRGELCTPTGAALLKHFADEFGAMPPMVTSAIGYGMGKKDFPAANCVRAMLGEDGGLASNDEVVLLSCNIDDATGEQMGYAQEALLAMGALDVFVSPIQMKKNRPGQLLGCLARPRDADRLAVKMLALTPTFGVRRQDMRRYALTPSIAERQTPYGAVRVKTGEGYGLTKCKVEYEDVKAAAETHGLSIDEVQRAVWALDKPRDFA